MSNIETASPEKGELTRGCAALLVFAGGACYGANASCYKLAFALGFTSAQMMTAQIWFATLTFGLAFLVGRALGRKWTKLSFVDMGKLVLLGVLSATTTILYCYAMSTLPVPFALTLLFQFTWLGTVIQVVMTRRAPSAAQVLSALLVVVGTVFASGLYESGISSFDPLGIACGLLAALSCALFVVLSGKLRVDCSDSQRGLLVCLGALVITFFVCPDFGPSGVLLEGIAPFGLVTGAIGFVMPVLLFGIAAPHLPAGISTILAASELPSGLLVAMVILSTPVTLVQWVGVVVILLGVCLSQVRLRKNAS